MSESLAIINEYLDKAFMYGPFWAYFVIFAACFIENIAPPFPGDSFIVAAGGLVAVNRLDPVYGLLTILIGGMASIMFYYYLGRRYGRDYFMRKNFRFFSAEDIVAMEARFERRGWLLLVASRFIVGFRVALALAAGIGKYPAGRMFVYTLISYILFSSLLMYLGFKLVENFDRIGYYFRTYNYIGWPIVIAIILIWGIRRYRKIRERNG